MWTVNLAAGDLLYIPKYWYHQVTPTSDYSVSVNYFHSSLGEYVCGGVLRDMCHYAHLLGLYKSGHCVCHKH